MIPALTPFGPRAPVRRGETAFFPFNEAQG
jgi:hypothetical protein